MTTRLLDIQTEQAAQTEPETGWEQAEDWVCDVLDREGLTRARNVVGLRKPCRLELLVDGESAASIEVDADLGQACGVAVAYALLQRQSRGDCETWELRLSVHDDEVGADLLIREWRY